jgi:hypothetical protein
MNRFYLKGHSSLCNERRELAKEEKDDFIRSWTLMSCGKNDVLFYHNCDFHIVTFNDCKCNYDKYDFYINLISQIIDNSKVMSSAKVINKSMRYVDYKEEFKDLIRLQSFVYEVNYTYSDNAGKDYCIVTKDLFIDALLNEGLIEENYIKGRDYLIENKLSHLESQLNELYRYNRGNMNIWDKDKFFAHRVDDIINFINKESK